MTPIKPTRKLPRKVSTRAAYWQGFTDGAQEEYDSWRQTEIDAYYARTRGY